MADTETIIEKTEPDFLSTFTANAPIPKSQQQQTAPEPKAEQKQEPPKAAPKQEAPKEPAAPQDDSDLPEGLKGKSGAAAAEFRKIRASEQELKKWKAEHELKLKEYEEKLSKSKGPDEETAKKIAEYEARNKEYSDKLKVLAIERHPDFVKHYGERIEKAENAVLGTVPADKRDTLKKIIDLPVGEFRTEKLEQFADGLSSLAQSTLAAALLRVDEVKAERAGELAQAEDRLKKLSAEESKQREASEMTNKQKQEARTKAALEASNEYDAFKTIEGNDAHNQAIAARKEFVSGFFAGKIPNEIVPKIPALVQEAMYLRESVVPSLKAEIEKRDKTIAEMTAATPKVGDKSQKSAKGAEGQDFESVFTSNAPKRSM